MELVARQMLMLLSDYRAFDEAYRQLESEDIFEIENIVLGTKWKNYFGDAGSWEDFRHTTLIDDPSDGEFLFYLADYLKAGYCNIDVALQQALSVVWTEDDGLKLMAQNEQRCYRR